GDAHVAPRLAGQVHDHRLQRHGGLDHDRLGLGLGRCCRVAEEAGRQEPAGTAQTAQGDHGDDDELHEPALLGGGGRPAPGEGAGARVRGAGALMPAYGLRFTSSGRSWSGVETARASAGNPRSAMIMLVTSWARPTLDCPSEPATIVPRPAVPGLPIAGVPEV